MVKFNHTVFIKNYIVYACYINIDNNERYIYNVMKVSIIKRSDVIK